MWWPLIANSYHSKATNCSVPPYLSAILHSHAAWFQRRAGLCLPGVDCSNKRMRTGWQLRFTFHNRGAPARHLLALNESCLHRPMQFIAPVYDCLTSCLHSLIYFSLRGDVHSEDIVFHCSYMYVHTCTHTQKQSILTGSLSYTLILLLL